MCEVGCADCVRGSIFCMPSERGKLDPRASGVLWAGTLPDGAVGRDRETARSYGRELVAFQGHR